MSKPEPNKQREVTAASFRRLAKGLRIHRRDQLKAGNVAIAFALQLVATELDAEAKLLRSMR